jgi:peroxiredoxin Q/BCP
MAVGSVDVVGLRSAVCDYIHDDSKSATLRRLRPVCIPVLTIKEVPKMLAEGDKAPGFKLQDQDGNTVTLASLRGSAVVLYFYPKDDTPGCTREACAFRDARADYAKAGAKVVGISPDAVPAHRKFAEKYELPFTLLADPEKKACEAYGVWQEKNMYGKKTMGVVRTTFVLDPKGKIRKVFPRVKVDGHADAVLKAIKEL